MELVIGLFVVVVILGALAGGKSFGGTILSGIIVLVLLIGAVSIYASFEKRKKDSKFDEYSNYNLCVRNAGYKKINVEMSTAYVNNGGEFGGNMNYNFDIEPQHYTELVATIDGVKRRKSFGGIKSVIVDKGRFKLSQENMKIQKDSGIFITDTGISIEPGNDCTSSYRECWVGAQCSNP